MLGKRFTSVAACTLAATIWGTSVQAGGATETARRGQPADLAIALDVSGSMDGLIDSAKQRLWDIVNTIGQAQPEPDLRLAIITYGNPGYGQQNGYIRIDQPFTRDLDAVMETLFSFETNGGDEYVAGVVQTATRELDWSTRPDALRILFVAGNEGADQDPQTSIRRATDAAAAAGIVVNTIYCGGENDPVVSGWREVATRTNGHYASIDQGAAAVATIATPFDAELTRLNEELNSTYVAYGANGEKAKENQLRQDQNAMAMSAPSAVSRVVAKSGTLYRNESWDMVDALEAGVSVGDMDAEDLPDEMKALPADERVPYVQALAKRREVIRSEIEALDRKRTAVIATERASRAGAESTGLDAAIVDGMREVANRKGFSID